MICSSQLPSASTSIAPQPPTHVISVSSSGLVTASMPISPSWSLGAGGRLVPAPMSGNRPGLVQRSCRCRRRHRCCYWCSVEAASRCSLAVPHSFGTVRGTAAVKRAPVSGPIPAVSSDDDRHGAVRLGSARLSCCPQILESQNIGIRSQNI